MLFGDNQLLRVPSRGKYSSFCQKPAVAFLRDSIYRKLLNKNNTAYGAMCSHWSLQSRNSQYAYAEVRVMQTPFTPSSIAL
jgi:hypothetical protein